MRLLVSLSVLADEGLQANLAIDDVLAHFRTPYVTSFT